MLVKFTNAVPEHLGMPIYIETTHILSVFEMPTDGGSLRTMIYGVRGDTWQVGEGLKETVDIINGDIIDVR